MVKTQYSQSFQKYGKKYKHSKYNKKINIVKKIYI